VKSPKCAGNHSAFSKSCHKWPLLEKRVEEVKAEKGISFIEARKIVSAESTGRSAPGGRTAAAVVGSRSVPTSRTTACFSSRSRERNDLELQWISIPASKVGRVIGDEGCDTRSL